eukprot:10696871-Alexandrium_andersonii.AAC.2
MPRQRSGAPARLWQLRKEGRPGIRREALQRSSQVLWSEVQQSERQRWMWSPEEAAPCPGGCSGVLGTGAGGAARTLEARAGGRLRRGESKSRGGGQRGSCWGCQQEEAKVARVGQGSRRRKDRRGPPLHQGGPDNPEVNTAFAEDGTLIVGAEELVEVAAERWAALWQKEPKGCEEEVGKLLARAGDPRAKITPCKFRNCSERSGRAQARPRARTTGAEQRSAACPSRHWGRWLPSTTPRRLRGPSPAPFASRWSA